MKQMLQPYRLPALILGLGVITLALRWAQSAFAMDEKNLLVAGHPLTVLILLAAAGAVLLTTAAVKGLDGSARYEDNFRSSPLAAAGTFALAAGICITVWTLRSGQNAVGQVCNAVGILAALGLVLTGISRLQGTQPFFAGHALTSMYFALHLVIRYRMWSGNPRLEVYGFSLLAYMALTLFSYHQTAFDVGSGKRRPQLWLGLMSVYLCIAALWGAEYVWLYLAGAFWALTNLCSLTPVPQPDPETDGDH